MAKNRKSYWNLVKLLTILVVALAIFIGRQSLYDFWRLRTYTPAKEITQLVADNQMTDLSRKYLYVMHAQMDTKAQFNNDCQTNEKTIVIGCHVSHRGIYILEVADVRLDGIEQVTAAHEMLHEAYERLSNKDRARIDKLTNAAYVSLDNSDLNEKINSYRAQDPESVPSELHSILGTEYGNLAPDLENYYARYFKNRQVVVGFSQKYKDEFEQRRNTVNQYDAQLLTLKAQIDSLQASLSVQLEDIQGQREQLNQLEAQGETAQYNAGVPSFNQKVNSYNEAVAHLQNLIDQYNVVVKQRNNIVVEESQLKDAIDSHTPTEIPQN